MALCKFCNTWMPKGVGKREKEFCNNTCRSNFWYAKNKKGKEKIVFVKPTPESFDGGKTSRLLSDEFGQTGKVEPLSFEKLKQTPIFSQVPPQIVMKKYWDEKRELTADEYPDWLSRLYSDQRLTDRQKDVIKNTNQSE